MTRRVSVLFVFVFLQSALIFCQQDTAKISALLHKAQIAHDHHRLDSARQLSFQLLEMIIGQDSFSFATQIKVLQLLGAVHQLDSRSDEAEAYYKEALTVAKTKFPGNSGHRAWAYYLVSWVNQGVFDLEEWSAYLDTAQQLSLFLPTDGNCILGHIWIDRSRMNYFMFGPPDTTIAYLRSAERIYRVCGTDTQRNYLAVHKGLYDVYLAMRQFDSAGYYLRLQMDDIPPGKGGMADLQQGTLKMNQANLHRLDGRYEEAITIYQSARNIFEHVPEVDSMYLLNCDLYVAWCLNAIGKKAEALKRYYTLFRVADGYSKLSGDLLALMYHGIALAYTSAGIYDSAVYACKKSLEVFGQSLQSTNAKLIPLYIVYGNALLHAERHQQADSILRFVHQLSITTYGYEHPITLQAGLQLSLAAIRHGKFEGSKRLLDSLKQLSVIEQYPELSYHHAIASAELLVRRNGQKGFTKDERTQLITDISLAIQGFRNLRNLFVSEEARSRTVITSIGGLHSLMPWLFQFYVQEPNEDLYNLMLQISETHRGLILSEAIGQSAAYTVAGVPLTLQQKERAFKTSLARVKKKIEQEYTRAAPKQVYLSALFAEVLQLQEELEELISLFREEYPEYYLARFAPNTIDVATVQSRLGPDEVLVEYLIVAETIYAFVITTTSFHIYATNEANLNELTREFIDLMSGQRTTERSLRLDNISKELYRYLIEPVSQQLQGKSSLIVVPDRVLFYFPFEMLQSDLQAGSPLGYLVNRHRIQYQPSLFLWTQMYIEERMPVKRVLTVAPSFTTANSSTTRESTFLPLKYASEESQDVHALWGGKLLTNRHASKANFIRLAPNSDIIHLATHAKADDRSGAFSWLAFSPQTSDSLLYLDEIYSLILDARMVVLSGCETGLGPLEAGEGLISMSRAFSYAGAESIVTSLWPVNDATTAQIMSAFYQYLKQGEPKDKALQMAKVDYLKTISDPLQADPYYWAGFIAMGDMTPLLSSTSFTPSWLVGVCAFVGLCVLILVIQLIVRKRQRANF